MNRRMPSLPVHHQLPEFTQTHIHRVGDAIQPSHPLSSPFPPAPNPSQHQSLFNESTLRMRWPKYWSFSFSIIPSKEQSGLISFRMDWLDLLAVQGTLKSLLPYRWLTNTWKDAQHHSLSEKCKSKPHWGTISRQSEWLRSKSLQAINAGEGVEKREPSYTVGGNAN